MSKHTPTPWKIENRSSADLSGQKHTNYQVNQDDGTAIALLGENKKANARLIAAAPELLDICKSQLEELKAIPDPYQWIRRHIRELEQIIAKAKGEGTA